MRWFVFLAPLSSLLIRECASGRRLKTVALFEWRIIYLDLSSDGDIIDTVKTYDQKEFPSRAGFSVIYQQILEEIRGVEHLNKR